MGEGGQKQLCVELVPGDDPVDAAAMDRGQKGTGEWGEREAEQYLVKKLGMRILERRWRKGHGELDLIMRQGKQMVFVEVRVRTGECHPLMLYRSIGRKKWKVLRKTAMSYVRNCSWRPDSTRFDVVGIQRSAAGKLVGLTHWQNVGTFGRNFRY